MQKWNFYTAKELRPQGWMRRQLEIQAEGLSGNLDKVWRDVRDSAWIGGNVGGWERVPYWLDGFIPLAYLLENEDMIKRAKKYVDAIISRQKPSGWICPCDEEAIPTYDAWAVQLIAKALVVYYECSADERIPEVIYKILKNYYELLASNKTTVFNWAQDRWYETFISINFLWERYKEEWIVELAKLIKAQGRDYTAHQEEWKRPLNHWKRQTHIVNIGMMLKYEAVSHEILGEAYTDSAERLLTVLKQYNGTPVGTFTGDECLAGLSPIQGTELCAVAEQMYSYECLLAYTGDNKWAQRLELLAYNALPATISDDMWTHQYDQMSNQIACQIFPAKRIFRTNGKEAHLFGLEPNFGCCTANFNQAWPKFALSGFMYSGNTVRSVVPIPTLISTDELTLSLKTDYPFENKLEYDVDTKKELCFKVRVPSFAKNLRVNGKAVTYCEELSFDISEGTHAHIEISFDTYPELLERPHNLKSVKCGSLIFALPISYDKRMLEYERDGVERKFPYCDYEYIPKSEWNFAYSSPFFEVEKREVGDVPFSSEKPPLVIKAEVKRIAWGLEDGYETVCAKVPESRIPLSEAKIVELYPYGCAKLRMTELPLI